MKMSPNKKTSTSEETSSKSVNLQQRPNYRRLRQKNNLAVVKSRRKKQCVLQQSLEKVEALKRKNKLIESNIHLTSARIFHLKRKICDKIRFINGVAATDEYINELIRLLIKSSDVSQTTREFLDNLYSEYSRSFERQFIPNETISYQSLLPITNAGYLNVDPTHQIQNQNDSIEENIQGQLNVLDSHPTYMYQQSGISTQGYQSSILSIDELLQPSPQTTCITSEHTSQDNILQNKDYSVDSFNHFEPLQTILYDTQPINQNYSTELDLLSGIQYQEPQINESVMKKTNTTVDENIDLDLHFNEISQTSSKPNTFDPVLSLDPLMQQMLLSPSKLTSPILSKSDQNNGPPDNTEILAQKPESKRFPDQYYLLSDSLSTSTCEDFFPGLLDPTASIVDFDSPNCSLLVL